MTRADMVKQVCNLLAEISSKPNQIEIFQRMADNKDFMLDMLVIVSTFYYLMPDDVTLAARKFEEDLKLASMKVTTGVQ